jgi:hypothetical protein
MIFRIAVRFEKPRYKKSTLYLFHRGGKEESPPIPHRG